MLKWLRRTEVREIDKNQMEVTTMTPEIHSPTRLVQLKRSLGRSTKRNHTINTARLVGNILRECQAELNCIIGDVTVRLLQIYVATFSESFKLN